jgi:hypothetical protein
MDELDYSPERCKDSGVAIRGDVYLLGVLSDAKNHLAGRGLMCHAEIAEILAAATGKERDRRGIMTYTQPQLDALNTRIWKMWTLRGPRYNFGYWVGLEDKQGLDSD